MQEALIEYAPEDKHMIKKMCRAIKDFTNFHMPVMDIRGCKCKTPAPIHIGEFVKVRITGSTSATLFGEEITE